MNDDIIDLNEYRTKIRHKNDEIESKKDIGGFRFPHIPLELCKGFSGMSRGIQHEDGTREAIVCSDCGDALCSGAL